MSTFTEKHCQVTPAYGEKDLTELTKRQERFLTPQQRRVACVFRRRKGNGVRPMSTFTEKHCQVSLAYGKQDLTELSKRQERFLTPQQRRVACVFRRRSGNSVRLMSTSAE
ncbi:MAG: hypothetical protein PHN52_13280 [candidate division Zixibacteria bacterium]|nr:hypothetical protein [candidate division Zixibacteria bacterium]